MAIMTNKLTTRQQIHKIFVASNNRWHLSGELIARVDSAKQSVYSAISAMATTLPLELERQSAGGTYEYRLQPELFNKLKKEFGIADTKATAKVEQPMVLETESTDLALPASQSELKLDTQQVPVTIVPEGVSGVALKKQKYRQAYWRDEDREAFALAFARLQTEQPLRDFELLASEAQATFPEEKRKLITKRSEISNWFETCLNKARIEAKKEKQEQDRLEQEERQLQESLRQQETMRQQQGQILQTLSNLDLFGEVMKRGQSMLETMFCNALQSPNVQRTLLETLNLQTSERRMYPRAAHSPEMPADSARPRLKRIGILGVNKPIHQTQMKQRMDGMYDLRFGNVDANAARLQESMANCDEVFLLTDHVPHRTNAQMKAANIKYTSMSGDKRAIEELLSKRYIDENQ